MAPPSAMRSRPIDFLQQSRETLIPVPRHGGSMARQDGDDLSGLVSGAKIRTRIMPWLGKGGTAKYPQLQVLCLRLRKIMVSSDRWLLAIRNTVVVVRLGKYVVAWSVCGTKNPNLVWLFIG